MSILKVARLGHPVLLQRAAPVSRRELATREIQRLIDDMIETMHDERGVGLAAPQVHRSLRLFVMDPGDRVEEGEARGLRVVVNPKLVFPDDAKIGLWEGCLSIPGIRGLTERFGAVDVESLDREGRVERTLFRGFPAAIVQHETDHLDGILFLQRMPDLARLAFEDQMARTASETDADEGDES